MAGLAAIARRAYFSALSSKSDRVFSQWMAKEIGVVPVPGSSFYHDKSLGRGLVRFAFCKKIETLEEASFRLRNMRARV